MDSSQAKTVSLEQAMPLIRGQLAAGQLVQFGPKGTSMLPLLRQGIDSVVLAPLPEKLKKYDLPLYQRDNGQYVLHRIVKAGATYTCVGDNQFALEPGVREDQMIALATAIVRDGKTVSVDSLGYRVYCRFWHFTRPLRGIWRRGKRWLRRKSKK